MFYSQFILAKKGPLGTIWIAAHLERKLRKNQVADTDIGVSVDSIICPDVPIALRLSSHLMLGVVRIYSRKVNYLFHDCSEALLKVKQAFRSAAVDLPPEESTAPYHSITLPETFDLEDFELPDNAIFDGNFVDHHVSTREQITLQDTMHGAVFSTTQFGLDERFGDGDASQIGLDLDEEMFLEKSGSLQSNFIAQEENNEYRIDVEPEAPLTNMDVDDRQDGLGQHDHGIAEIPKDLPNAYGYNIRTPDLNEMFSPAERTEGISLPSNSIDRSLLINNRALGDHSDHAQAPPTPGLLEEVVSVHTQEIPAMSQLDKPSPSNYVEEMAPEAAEVECQHKNANIIDGMSSLPECSVGIMGGTIEIIPVGHDEKLETFQNEVIPSDRVGTKQSNATVSPQDPLMNDQAYLGTMETPMMKTPVYELLGEGVNSSLTDSKPVHVGLSEMENTVISHSDKPEMHPRSTQGLAMHANSFVPFDSQAPISNFQSRPCFSENVTHALSFGGPNLSDKPEVHPRSTQDPAVHASSSVTFGSQAPNFDFQSRPCFSENVTHALSSGGPTLSDRPEMHPRSSQEPSVHANSSVTFHSQAPIPNFQSRPYFSENVPHALSVGGPSLSDKPETHPHSSQEPAVHASSSVTFNSQAPNFNFQSRSGFSENATHALSVGGPSLSDKPEMHPHGSQEPAVHASSSVPFNSQAPNFNFQSRPGFSENATHALSFGGPSLNDKPETHPCSSQEPAVHANSSVTFHSQAAIPNFQSRPFFSENATHALSVGGPSLSNKPETHPRRSQEPALHANSSVTFHLQAPIPNFQSRPYFSENAPHALSVGGPSLSDKREMHPRSSQEPAVHANSSVTFDSQVPIFNFQSRPSFSENVTYALSVGGPGLSGKPEMHPRSSQEPSVHANSSVTFDSQGPVSNFQLRPCFSENMTHTLSYGNPSLSDNSLQLRGPVSRENTPSACGPLVKEQGEGFFSASLLRPDMQIHKNLDTASLGYSTLNKEYDLPATSASIQTENPNCSASSEYPEPERMLRAPASEHGLHRNIEESTLEKGVTESDASVDRLLTLSGKKRRLTESTPMLLNESSMNLPGASRLKKNIGSVPGDDDLLASILAGRTTPSLKVKSTPTLPMIPSSKRARLNSKTGTPKRKVLLDDTMVLHADTIRQQLMSTEDIRRVRKKAPCTRSDVWRIQKCLLEEELFGESTLTGISDNLTLLHYRVYNLNDTFRSGVGTNPSPTQILQEQTQTKVPPADTNLARTDVVYNLNDRFRSGFGANPSRTQILQEQTQTKVPPADTNLERTDVVYNLNDTFRSGVAANPSPTQILQEQTQTKVPPANTDLERTDVLVMNNTINSNVNPECPDVRNLVHEKNCDLVEVSLANDLRQNGNRNVEVTPDRSDGFSCSIASDLRDGDTRYMFNKGVVAGSDQCIENASVLTGKNNVKEPSVTVSDGAPHRSDGISCSVVSDLHDGDRRYNMLLNKGFVAGSDQCTESASLLAGKNNVKGPSVTVTDDAPHWSNGLSCSVASDICDEDIRHSMLLNKDVAGSDKCIESALLHTDKNNAKEPSVKMTDGAPHWNDGLSCSIASDLPDGDKRCHMLMDKGVVAGSGQCTDSASLLSDKNNVKEASVTMTNDGLSLPPEQNPSVLSDFTVEKAVNLYSAGSLHNTENIDTAAESRNDGLKVPPHTFDADKPDINENGLEIRKEDIVDNENVSTCQLPPKTAANDQSMEMGFGVSRDGQLELSCPTVDDQRESLRQLNLETVTENAVSTARQTSGVQEADIAVPALTEPYDGEATPDSCDDGSAVDGDDTEFLNVVDEVDFDDDNNYDMPNPEEAQSQDNSGWSARTRGVARYLKILFSEDAGHTRNVVALDRLLSGKTRKEASRMFFETLVLKTKDYIHVEQENSFANIDIQPRSKLLKLDF